jgi:hypothetical protein
VSLWIVGLPADGLHATGGAFASRQLEKDSIDRSAVGVVDPNRADLLGEAQTVGGGGRRA